MDTKDNPHKNHRERLRARFVSRGAEGFFDHELLELALFYAIPRKDTNALAHELIKNFGGIEKLLEADISELSAFPGIGESAAVLLSLFNAIPARAEERRASVKTVLRTHADCISFVTHKLKGLNEENILLLCLNNRLQLIRSVVLSRGTVNSAQLNLRMLVEHALRNKASCAVLAHNHPSGSPAPSLEDDRLTASAFSALETVDVRLLDHIIVGEGGHYSYKSQRVIEELINRHTGAFSAARQSADFEAD